MSDRQVSSKAILDAVLELQRRGHKAVFDELEQIEPDLTEYLWETLGRVHRGMTTLGGDLRKTQAVFRKVQGMALVCVTAMRKAHYEMWKSDPANRSLEERLGDAGENDTPTEA